MRQFWRRWIAFVSMVGVAGTAIDVPYHAWPQLGILLGSTGLTLLISRQGFKAADARMERDAHRPDYRRIAQLERELGISEDPMPKPSRVMPDRSNPEFQSPDPARPLSQERPPVFKTYDDYMAYLRARTPPPPDK